MNLTEVCPKQSVQSASYVELRFVPPGRMSHWWNRCLRWSATFVQLAQHGFGFDIALRNLHLNEVVQLEGMAKSEEMLGAVVTHEGLSDGIHRRLAALCCVRTSGS